MSSTSIKWWLNKWIVRLIFLLPFAFNKHYAEAQTFQQKRYEHFLADFDNGFDVVPANENGVLLYRRFFNFSKDTLELIYLDTAFHEKWHGLLPVEKDYIITRHVFFNDSFYFIQRYRDYTKNDLQITTLNCDQQIFKRYIIRNFIPFTPTEFYITHKAAIIGGYFRDTPVVVYFDFYKQQAKVVPGLFNEPGELMQIKPYTDGSFDVLVSANNLMNKKSIWVRNYSEDGNIVRSTMLAPQGVNNLIFGTSIRTPDNRLIVAGAYSNRSKEIARGIFVATIDPSGDQQMTYYNYGDLENFFKHLRVNQEKRIKQRIERRKMKGRKLRFNYRMIVHELIPFRGQYILLGESYYPKYKETGTYGSGSFYLGGYSNLYRTRNGKIFDGFYYTHAIVLGFTAQGALRWDNNFKLNDIRTFNLDHFVSFDTKKDKISLQYLSQNEIKSQVIKDYEVLEGKTSESLKLRGKEDYVRKKDMETNKMAYWFKGTFIAYGTQWITNTKDDTRRKKVFFINRITRPGN